jgi:hypothetical protein
MPCHFVSTSYTDNFLEYSVIPLLHTNNSAVTNKIYFFKVYYHSSFQDLTDASLASTSQVTASDKLLLFSIGNYKVQG